MAGLNPLNQVYVLNKVEKALKVKLLMSLNPLNQVYVLNKNSLKHLEIL